MMDFSVIKDKALVVRDKINTLNEKNIGHAWSNREVMEGMVGDIGDLMKLVMAKEGSRHMDDIDNKLQHELSDILWCIFNLADRYGFDMEKVFIKKMDELEKRVDGEIRALK